MSYAESKHVVAFMNLRSTIKRIAEDQAQTDDPALLGYLSATHTRLSTLLAQAESACGPLDRAKAAHADAELAVKRADILVGQGTLDPKAAVANANALTVANAALRARFWALPAFESAVLGPLTAAEPIVRKDREARQTAFSTTRAILEACRAARMPEMQQADAADAAVLYRRLAEPQLRAEYAAEHDELYSRTWAQLDSSRKRAAAFPVEKLDEILRQRWGWVRSRQQEIEAQLARLSQEQAALAGAQ